MTKKPIIAGNWKMNKNPSEGNSFINEVRNLLLDIKNVSVIFAPPFTGLYRIDLKPPFFTAAQNCHWESTGALTGEISVGMIKDCGAQYVIVGHSERRKVFSEPDKWINKKIQSVLTESLSPILCIGETLEERNSGKTEFVLEKQLRKALINIKSIDNCIIAYEPVWAIGTGKTANYDQIDNAHKFIHKFLGKLYPDESKIHVLYGGSVNEGNAEDLIKIKGVNGFLIGGASLDAESFTSIIQSIEIYMENNI